MDVERRWPSCSFLVKIPAPIKRVALALAARHVTPRMEGSPPHPRPTLWKEVPKGLNHQQRLSASACWHLSSTPTPTSASISTRCVSAAESSSARRALPRRVPCSPPSLHLAFTQPQAYVGGANPAPLVPLRPGARPLLLRIPAAAFTAPRGLHHPRSTAPSLPRPPGSRTMLEQEGNPTTWKFTQYVRPYPLRPWRIRGGNEFSLHFWQSNTARLYRSH